MRHIVTTVLSCLLISLTACQSGRFPMEPRISYTVTKSDLISSPSLFPSLNPDERSQDWGKEFLIGREFALEGDFYRAITAYKRALFLIPSTNIERRIYLEYSIAQCYFLAGKYQEVVDLFENGALAEIKADFSGAGNLLIILHESYSQLNICKKADLIFEVIQKANPEIANDIQLSESIREGDLSKTNELAEEHPLKNELRAFECCYLNQAKSVRSAQTLNAILPGAGYLYVGQKKSALTSFLINALFIAATYQFFDHGYIAAGAITGSLELGWYIGGINGAGIAAQEYNLVLYEVCGREFMKKEKLYPVLLLEKRF